MATTPLITIYTRHSADCKYKDNELYRRCDCRKWLRWTADGRRERVQAKTRSWAEAENVKREWEDILSGKTTEAATKRGLQECVDIFLNDKRTEGVAADTVKTYTRTLNRLRDYCFDHHVRTIDGVTSELMSKYSATWDARYPSAVSRSKERERVLTFLRFAVQMDWLAKLPRMTRFSVEKKPTLPLDTTEFQHLLDSIDLAFPDKQAKDKRTRTRSLFLLMRHSGLSIMDAGCLPKSDIEDTGQGYYRIVTQRQKTGSDVSVPVPTEIAEEVLATPNDSADYILWTGTGTKKNLASKLSERMVKPVFVQAGLHGDCRMVSHRLRDTFACELLLGGVPIEEVSKLLGHDSVRTTEKHYSAWVRNRQERADALVIGTWKNKPKKSGKQAAQM
jgi:integrase/recombinase XerD